MNRILLVLYSFNHKDLELLKKSEIRLKSMYSILDEVNKPTLCHNDFYPRNILVSKTDDKYHLKAIIDLEQCMASDIDGISSSLFSPYGKR